ncbi:uncharacterized protein LOC123539780 [Mercenaria mercenaria]|uniref:uncharacterized protein LOC123539780 n=1 Tax=Mercenaria mercenaria TaxID=6596 RepID=UPI00234F6893|nr:uncharacterized protein LOC123539780 [Mercenaria mercenaria]XP_045180476.2 uncharacterized protein LOC123539780 [Mercenaria mercenaria]XP_045180477.2 uncharacterized protein LOC123539780 [Mercenaria mercenaria]
MAQYRIHDPEELLECPYDRVHMVRAKRFQYHLIKCRKNYTGTEFEKCPFNAKHQMPKPEFRHHLANCPDKAMVEPELSYAARKENGEVNMLKGCTDTPVYRELDIQSNEDWDAEVSAPVRVGPQYDNTYFERVQFKDLSGLNKNQKAIIKDNRLTTKQKMEELNSNLPNGNVAYGLEEENLRLPKTTSKAAMARKPQVQPIQQPVSSVFAYSIGQGRGRGRGAAANNTNANGEAPAANETFVPTMPFGRGMSMGNQPVGAVGIGRGMTTGGVGRGNIAPPPGFCVPKVANDQADRD